MPVVDSNWIGEGTSGTTTNGRRGLQLYKALQMIRTKGNGRKARQMELIVAVGDYVHLRGPNKRQPYVARIMDLWEDPRTSQKMLTAQWCYRPNDLPQDCVVNHTFRDDNEVVFTELLDENEIGTILEPVRICFSRPSKSKPYISTLFMDQTNSNSWKDGPSAFQQHSRYFCSKTYVPRTNRLMRLTEEDVETATRPVRGMSTKCTNQLLHQLAHLKVAQMEVQEEDACDDGPSWISTNKPETDENDGSMNAGHSNPPPVQSPSLNANLFRKRSFKGDSDEEQHYVKRERKEQLEPTNEFDQALSGSPDHPDPDLMDQFNNNQIPFTEKDDLDQEEIRCRLGSCVIQ